MERESLSFSVQMTSKELFRFLIYHSYHRLSGIIGICLSLLAIIGLVSCYDNLTDQNKAVYVIVALWFTVLEPVTLFSRARGQMKTNPAYKQPLSYEINPEGITVSQGEESQSIAWTGIVRVVKTKRQYLVYSSKIASFIFPKESIGEDCDLFEKLIAEYMGEAGMKIPANMRRDR